MKLLPLIITFLLINNAIAQQTDFVDFLECKAEIMPLPDNKGVRGVCVYTFVIKKAIDSIYIDAKNMIFDNVQLEKRKTQFKVTSNKLWLYKNICQ